jgi:hypothetical protein
MTLPIDYGTVDPLSSALRYTTLDEIKGRMGIPLADLTLDAVLTQAGIAAEYAIDVELGRSFPDGPGVPDESEPGPIQGIPEAVKSAATSTAIAVYKEADAPIGTAGSEAFFGSMDVADIARRIVTRSIVLRGFRVGSGFGVA